MSMISVMSEIGNLSSKVLEFNFRQSITTLDFDLPQASCILGTIKMELLKDEYEGLLIFCFSNLLI